GRKYLLIAAAILPLFIVSAVLLLFLGQRFFSTAKPDSGAPTLPTVTQPVASQPQKPPVSADKSPDVKPANPSDKSDQAQTEPKKEAKPRPIENEDIYNGEDKPNQPAAVHQPGSKPPAHSAKTPPPVEKREDNSANEKQKKKRHWYDPRKIFE